MQDNNYVVFGSVEDTIATLKDNRPMGIDDKQPWNHTTNREVLIMWLKELKALRKFKESVLTAHGALLKETGGR